jgi:hypothetical protein
MSRAVSVTQLYVKKRNLLAFEGEYAASFGRPELKGAWLIWAKSGSGKTTFVLKLCKYLTRFGRVAYNSMEEGDSESFKLACQRVSMEEVKAKFFILDNESIEELKERLRKHKAPNIVVVDSLQYSMMSYKDYVELKKEFPNVLFLFISHAEGKEPKGKVASSIQYDVSVKIRVEGYRAFPISRYGGGLPFDIWKEGADKYHGATILM